MLRKRNLKNLRILVYVLVVFVSKPQQLSNLQIVICCGHGTLAFITANWATQTFWAKTHFLYLTLKVFAEDFFSVDRVLNWKIILSDQNNWPEHNRSMEINTHFMFLSKRCKIDLLIRWFLTQKKMCEEDFLLICMFVSIFFSYLMGCLIWRGCLYHPYK